MLDWPARSRRREVELLEQSENRFRKARAIPIRRLGLFLRQQGIQDLVIAGEVGPYHTLTAHSHEGCIGRVYSILKQTLPIRGVQNGIFPLIPDKTSISPEFHRGYQNGMHQNDEHLFRDQEQLFQDLYDNAVTIP